jgi:peroxiredoxin Q/BCP
MTHLKEGDPAPGFSLPVNGGRHLSLEELKGKPVVIYFYPKDDTSGCTKEAVAFSENKAKFDALGVSIIGISPDSVAKHEKFIAKHDLKVTLAADEDKQACEAYGVWVEKSMYGRKYMGVERSTFLIDANGSILTVWSKVKVPGHVEEVLKTAENIVPEGIT